MLKTKSFTKHLAELWALEILVSMIRIAVGHESLARIKPLRSGKPGPQILLENAHILVDTESNHLPLVNRQVFFIYYFVYGNFSDKYEYFYTSISKL